MKKLKCGGLFNNYWFILGVLFAFLPIAETYGQSNPYSDAPYEIAPLNAPFEMADLKRPEFPDNTLILKILVLKNVRLTMLNAPKLFTVPSMLLKKQVVERC